MCNRSNCGLQSIFTYPYLFVIAVTEGFNQYSLIHIYFNRSNCGLQSIFTYPYIFLLPVTEGFNQYSLNHIYFTRSNWGLQSIFTYPYLLLITVSEDFNQYSLILIYIYSQQLRTSINIHLSLFTFTRSNWGLQSIFTYPYLLLIAVTENLIQQNNPFPLDAPLTD